MSAVSDKTMSQENLLLGMEVFNKPHQKACYLAQALVNEVACAQDVAELASKIFMKGTFGGEVSIVLSTLFHLKTIAKERDEKVVEGFYQAVNQILGPDHIRRLVDTNRIKNLDITQDSFIRDGLAARSETAEKVYFLANVLIADLKIGWKSMQKYKLNWHSKEVEMTVVTIAVMDSLSLFLSDFLKTMTGKDQEFCGEHEKTLNRMLEASARRANQQPAAEGSCIVA